MDVNTKPVLLAPIDWVHPLFMLTVLLLIAYFPTFIFHCMFGDDYNEIYHGGSLRWLVADSGRPMRYFILQITALIFRANPEILLLPKIIVLLRCTAFILVLSNALAFYYFIKNSEVLEKYAIAITAILFTTPAFIIKSTYFIYTVQYFALLPVVFAFYLGFYRPLNKGRLNIQGAAIAITFYTLAFSIYQIMVFYVGALIILLLLFHRSINIKSYRVHMLSFAIQAMCSYFLYKLTTMLAIQYYGLEATGRYSGGLKSIVSNFDHVFSSDAWTIFAHWVYLEPVLMQWALIVIVFSVGICLYTIYKSRKTRSYKETLEKGGYLLGCLFFSLISYIASPRVNYSQTGPAMCAIFFILIYSIRCFWRSFPGRRLTSKNALFKIIATVSVTAISILSANSTVSSMAYFNALELAHIETEIAKHHDSDLKEIVQVVPFIKKWKVPELCYTVPCKGEFAWKMTSLVNGAKSQLFFVKDLLCKDNQQCSDKNIKIKRVVKAPERLDKDAVLVDMRPLYRMHQRRGLLHQ
jgi:hypothetical protein